MEQLDEIITEFLVESYENLDQLDQDLLALEEEPNDRERLASIFRTIHTIKGTSGFLAFPKLEHVTHSGESLLVKLRDGELELNNSIADGLLAMIDAVREILSHIESTSGEGDGEYDTLVRTLEALRDAGAEAIAGPAPVTADEPSTAEPDSATDSSEVDATSPAENADAGPSSQPAEVQSADVSDAVPASADSESDSSNADARDSGEAPQEPMPSEPAPVKTPAANAQPESGSEADRHSLAETTVRLDVRLLDRLMNLVGELVLARNQIMQYSRSQEDATILATSQRLNLITSELQEGVMKTRMQPIRNVWSKLPRVVRDLANSCGKQVEVKMEGADTELDKTILEAIKDPLTHIVRNSVDHGIESSDVRSANGKNPTGTLLLRAFHEGGQVNVEITDDGGGINLDRVRDKAIAKEMVTKDQAAKMTDRELLNLILRPGFSTAQKVTNVSGRGVGMDVVKTNVEKIGGSLDIQSVQGTGTTLRIRIPLTLAIVPALVITCDNDRYAIPQVSLLELVRIDMDRADFEIERIHNFPVYRLRGRLLPLLYLDECLGLRPKRTSFGIESQPNGQDQGDEPDEHSSINIVVLQAEDRQFGLVVDEINDTQEIVVKPLGEHLKEIKAFAGTTIMGDGRVALILDIVRLAHEGNVLAEHNDPQVAKQHAVADDSVDDRKSLLIVDPGDGSRSAIRLDTVSRLEEIEASKIELSGYQEVVQYRDEIMPLLPLAEGGYSGAGEADPSGRDMRQVVVYNQNGRSVGVVVGKIVDIVEHNVSSTETDSQIVAKRVTKLVNLEEFVGQSLGT